MFTAPGAVAQLCHTDFGSIFRLLLDNAISNLSRLKCEQVPWSVIWGPETPYSTYAFPGSHRWNKKTLPATAQRMEWRPRGHMALGLHGRVAHYGGPTSRNIGKYLFFLPFQPIGLKVKLVLFTTQNQISLGPRRTRPVLLQVPVPPQATAPHQIDPNTQATQCASLF